MSPKSHCLLYVLGNAVWMGHKRNDGTALELQISEPEDRLQYAVFSRFHGLHFFERVFHHLFIHEKVVSHQNYASIRDDDMRRRFTKNHKEEPMMRYEKKNECRDEKQIRQP